MSEYGNWERTQVRNLGKVVTGRTPPTVVTSYFGNAIPFITPSDMDGRRTITTTERYLSLEGARLLSSCQVPAQSICVSCIGWQMGKVVMTHELSITNQQINTIIPNNDVVPEFIYYSLSTRREELKRLGSVGTRTPILNKSAFEDLSIVLPPLPTQRKIASILSTYDDLIENNTRRIAILEEMAQALYREWFVHFRFPGHEQARMVESEMGPVPEGWEVKRLGEIAREVRRAVSPAEVDPDTPYIGLEHLPRKSIALSEWGAAKEVQSTKLRFRQGEILFGKIRPYFHKVGVVPVNGVCSSDAIVISPNRPDHFAIVLSVVSSEAFVNHATQTSQGTKMPRANWDVLVNYPVVLPPSTLRTQFNDVISGIVEQIHNLIFRNRNLGRTRDLLLPKLVAGEVDVEGVEVAVEATGG